MQTFTVIWEVEVEAETEMDACRKALEMQRDPNSGATIFRILLDPDTGEVELYDLSST